MCIFHRNCGVLLSEEELENIAQSSRFTELNFNFPSVADCSTILEREFRLFHRKLCPRFMNYDTEKKCMTWQEEILEKVPADRGMMRSF